MSEAIDRRREAFRAWVKAQGGVKAVASKADVPPTTIYSYLGGKSQSLKGITQDAIAQAYSVGADDLFGGRATVPVVGYVQAGAEAILYAEGQGPFDEVPAPHNATPSTVALQSRGESLGPMFSEWLVYYDDVRSPITPDLFGKLCVVGLLDGRVVVKQIKQAGTEERFHLLSQNDGPMLDQEVLWGAVVTAMTPR